MIGFLLYNETLQEVANNSNHIHLENVCFSIILSNVTWIHIINLKTIWVACGIPWCITKCILALSSAHGVTI